MDRREFLISAAATTGSIVTGVEAQREKPKKILVVGGTNFVGAAIVDEALARGHDVTLFNRGITRPYLYPGVEKLIGDRYGEPADLAALHGTRSWDAVIDVWPEEERPVRELATLLGDRTDYYYFVSSIAVYRDFGQPEMSESAETRLGEDGYGGEKARTEKWLAQQFPDRYGVARCPSIFGPRDPGSSLHYWLRSLYNRQEIIGPGDGSDPVQFVDCRDVAAWVINCTEQQRVGVYNTTGATISFREYLAHCKTAVQSDCQISWLSGDFLYEQDVEAFVELPLWFPEEEDPGFFRISSEMARRDGFRTRQPSETLRDAWTWYRSAFFNSTTFPHNGWGLSPERQDQLLEVARTKS